MLAQSAMLETVFTLVYVITVGFGSPLQNAFLPILGQVQVKIHLPSGHFFVWLMILAGDRPNASHLSCGTPRSGINDRTTQTI